MQFKSELKKIADVVQREKEKSVAEFRNYQEATNESQRKLKELYETQIREYGKEITGYQQKIDQLNALTHKCVEKSQASSQGLLQQKCELDKQIAQMRQANSELQK